MKLRPALNETELVTVERQISTGSDLCRNLTKGSRGGVAGVDVEFRFLAGGFGLRYLEFVERLEARQLHVDLTAHFKHRWRAVDLLRNVADRAHIVSDVFSDPAIAAGGSLYQRPHLRNVEKLLNRRASTRLRTTQATAHQDDAASAHTTLAVR